MEFIDPKLDEYVCLHTSEEPEILYNLNRETHLKALRTRMISGHFQGRLLSMISKLLQPVNILEIGTYTGYSALCLAEGLKKDGKLITIDINVELEDIVSKYFSLSDYKNQLQFITGDAHEIIPTLDVKFDLIFIDADKQNYLNYYEQVIEKLNSGGIILSDNVLWSGKVIEEIETKDQDTQKIVEYNTFIKNDPRVETILLPIRDGIMITRKL